MEKSSIEVYGYRWIVLVVFAIINAVMQLQWLTFAPIAREAKVVYDVSGLQIDFLSMIFMAVFLIMCVPASYVIDTYGIRVGVGSGAVLIGVFGLLKGIGADSYTMVVISQVGLAVAQPFILNACTKVGVQWFPITERATAVGIATLSQFLGIIVVMIVTPLLVSVNAEGVYNIKNMLITYGVISTISAVILLVFMRERPPTPPDAKGREDRFKVFEGCRFIFKQRDMLLVMVLFFVGLGMFNAISTCIDQICHKKGLSIEQTGLVGGIMLIGGIMGALILPLLSDRYRARKSFLVLIMICMTPGLIGLTLFKNYMLVLTSSFVLGFFLLGGGAPIGFQYSAEISYPAPESTSQGLILLVGQISGIIFILGLNGLGVTPFMYLFVILAGVNIFITTILKESTMIRE